MAIEYLDPNSDIEVSWNTSGFANIADAVRSPTDPTTGGNGLSIAASDKGDNNDEDQYGCANAINTGTATQVSLFAYGQVTGSFTATGNVRINNVWQTAQSINLVGWNSINFNGTWDMATEIVNMGMAFTVSGLANGETWRVHAAYLQITYSAGGVAAITSVCPLWIPGIMTNLATDKVSSGIF